MFSENDGMLSEIFSLRSSQPYEPSFLESLVMLSRSSSEPSECEKKRKEKKEKRMRNENLYEKKWDQKYRKPKNHSRNVVNLTGKH